MGVTDQTYRLHTLGEARLTLGRETLQLGMHGLVLLAYLSLARRPPSRPELCELLWSVNGAGERHRLRQLLYTIKRRAPGLLTDAPVALSETSLDTDIASCISLAQQGELLQALDMFAGPFFATVPSLTHAFTEWRDQWSAHLITVLRVAVHARLNRPGLEHPEVLKLCEWVSEYDELAPHEVIYRAKALTAVGAATAAAIDLHRLADAPLPRELRFEFERLQEQVGLTNESRMEQSPLVLADSVRTAVAARLTSVTRGAIILLVGESGVGKSRLLDWAARLAAIRGARVFTHAIAVRWRGKVDARFQLIEALSAGGSVNRQQPSARTDTVTLAGETADRLGSRWTVIAVDNINHADGPTKEFLRLVPAMSKAGSVTLIVAMNGSVTPADLEWIDALLPNVDVIRVDPLPYHLSSALIDKAAAQAGLHLTDDQRQMIVNSSHGVPGRLLNLATALAHMPSASARMGPGSDVVSGVISNNMRSLPNRERKLLGVLALSEGNWTRAELPDVTGMPEPDLDCALDALGGVRLLNICGDEVSVGALVRETFIATEEPRKLRQIRAMLAEYYVAIGHHARAAIYFDDLGDRPRAGEQYQLAGTYSLEKGLFDEAEHQLKLAWARAMTPEEFQERSRLLAACYSLTGRWDEAHPHLLALSSRTADEELGLLVASLSGIDGHHPEVWRTFIRALDSILTRKIDQVMVARAYLKVFDAAYQWGMEPLVLSSFQEYLRRQSTQDPRELAELLTKSARINKLFGDAARAPEDAEAAVANAQRAHDPVILAHAYDTRALVHALNGEVDRAFADFEESEKVANSARLYFLRERYLNNLAVLCYETGDLDRARQLLLTASLLSRESHPYALANLAVVELAARRHDEARSYATRLRATTSSTGRIIGTTIHGLLCLTESCAAQASELFWQLHTLTHGFRLQLTDPSYTLVFVAACGPIVQFDARSLLESNCAKLRARNVYSFLRVRLALVRLLWITGAGNVLPMVEETLQRALEVRAVGIQGQAEALLSSF